MLFGMNVDELQGQTAVITGASRGLGAGLAREFHRRGMKLGLCSRSVPAMAGEEGVLAERLDVTEEEAVEQFARHVEDRFGRIHLWINNAGVLEPIGTLRSLDVADFRRHIDVNVVGVFLGTRAYVRHLHRIDAPGTLVNISSGAARSPYAGWSAYCSGKAAVDLLTECVCEEEKARGLRAFAVAPGVIDTAMQEIIRTVSSEDFPMVGKFIEMKEKGTFSTIEHVARELLRLVYDPAPGGEAVRTSLPRPHQPTGR